MTRLNPLLALALGAAMLGACTDPIDPVPVDETIPVPSAYVFESRFVEGESSVAYPGQTVRNLLAQDLKNLIGGLGRSGASAISEQDLLDRYDYSDDLDLQTLTTVDGAPVLESHYSAIAMNKNLTGKISNQVIIGYGKTADALIRDWFRIIAEQSQDPEKLGTPAVYTSPEGVDLSQMVEKVLAGAVVYSQGTSKYLSDEVLFGADNTQAEPGKPYTSMEHKWDESFGYFGAARDYGRYTDAQLAGGSSEYTHDSDGDGFIDLRSEYNFSFARYAGKRDRGATGVDFTKNIFEAYLRGRTAIVNQASTQEIAAERQIIVEAWERLVAANVVHYLNSSLSDLAGLAAEDVPGKSDAAYNTHWTEMRAFTIALQYNPFRQISDSQLQQLADLMGTAPVYAESGTVAHDQAVADLEAAKAILKSVYTFSDENMESW